MSFLFRILLSFLTMGIFNNQYVLGLGQDLMNEFESAATARDWNCGIHISNSIELGPTNERSFPWVHLNARKREILDYFEAIDDKK